MYHLRWNGEVIEETSASQRKLVTGTNNKERVKETLRVRRDERLTKHLRNPQAELI